MKTIALTVSAILLSTCCSAFAQDHVVTAWRTQWIYNGSYSGRGQENPVRIQAAPGDTVDFRQSEGEHGVFFYGKDQDDSDLGVRIEFESMFDVVVGHKPAAKHAAHAAVHRQSLAPSTTLPSLSSTGLFRHTRGRSTSLRQGRATIITIQLTESFDQPIYFGDLGQDGITGFGVLIPGRTATSLPESDASPQSIERSQFVFPKERDLSRSLETLRVSQISGDLTYDLNANAIMRSLPKWSRDAIVEPQIVTKSVFADELSDLSPSQENPWLGAITRDFDGDGSQELVVLSGDATNPENQRIQLFKSNEAVKEYARLRQAVTGTPKLVEDDAPRSTPTFDRHKELALRGKLLPLDKAFIKDVDLDQDGLVDLVIGETVEIDGKSKTVLQPYFNQGNLDFKLGGRAFDVSDRLESGSILTASVQDVDFDGWPDLILVPSRAADRTFVALNDGERKGFLAEAAQSAAIPKPNADAHMDHESLELPKNPVGILNLRDPASGQIKRLFQYEDGKSQPFEFRKQDN